MSVTAVTTANEGLGGETKGTATSTTTRAHRAAFRVTAAAGDTWDIIDSYFRNDGSLPYPGRVFDLANGRDTRSKCVSLRGDYITNSEGKWLVYATYEEVFDSFTGPADQNGQPSDDPADWHDEIEITTTQMSIAVVNADYLGNSAGKEGPFIFPGRNYKPCNSTGKAFDPGIEEEHDITILRITKYQPIYNDAFYSKYINTVNSTDFTISKPAYRFQVRILRYTAKMKAINSTYHVTDKGKRYWKHTLEVHINLLTWRRQLADIGFCERLRIGDYRMDNTIVTTSDVPLDSDHIDEEITDSAGMSLTEPSNLDGAGRRRASADMPAVTLYWRTVREEDWSGIQW